MNNKLLSVIFNFIVAIIVAVVVLAVSLPIFFVVDYPRIREFTSPDTSTQCTVLDKTPASSNSCPVVNSCICEFCDITIYPMCSQLKDEIYLNRTGDLGSQSCCGHGYETSCNMGIFRSTCTATMTRCQGKLLTMRVSGTNQIVHAIDDGSQQIQVNQVVSCYMYNDQIIGPVWRIQQRSLVWQLKVGLAGYIVTWATLALLFPVAIIMGIFKMSLLDLLASAANSHLFGQSDW